jgi:outer membrane protein assembly factor BamB
VALDRDGNIFVSDWGNDRIQKFTPGGDVLDVIPGPGRIVPDSDRITHPAGLCVGGHGNIYVADWGNERVRVLSAEGEVLATLRGESQTPTWANEYFVANPEEGALRLEADLSPVVDPPERRDREESANVEKLFWGPTAVKLDGQGNILVVDSCRHRIQVYRWQGH